MFNSGRTSTCNDERDGRPSNTVKDETVNIMRTQLGKDQCYMLNNLHHKIATHYKYVSCSRNINSHNSLQTSEDAKSEHVSGSSSIVGNTLELERSGSFEFSNAVWIGRGFICELCGYGEWDMGPLMDAWIETDVYATEKERWNCSLKIQKSTIASNMMATVFWNWESILLIEYLPQWSTATFALYFDTSYISTMLLKTKDVEIYPKKFAVS